MLQPKYNHKKNVIFLGSDSIEINLVFDCNCPVMVKGLKIMVFLQGVVIVHKCQPSFFCHKSICLSSFHAKGVGGVCKHSL